MKAVGRVWAPPAAPPPGTPIDWTHPLAAGLVGCWNFAAAAGLRAEDTTGGGADATLGTGVTWSAANARPAIQQPVTAVITTVADRPQLNVQQLSVFCLFTLNTFNGSGNKYMFVRSSGSAGFRLFVNASSSDMKAYVNDGTTTVTQFTPIGGIALKQTYHYGFTYNGALLSLYINGKPSANATGAIVPNVPSANVGFMNYPNGPTSGFAVDGWLHQALLYNRAMSPDAVAWLAAEPFAMFQPLRVTRGRLIGFRPQAGIFPKPAMPPAAYE